MGHRSEFLLLSVVLVGYLSWRSPWQHKSMTHRFLFLSSPTRMQSVPRESLVLDVHRTALVRMVQHAGMSPVPVIANLDTLALVVKAVCQQRDCMTGFY